MRRFFLSIVIFVFSGPVLAGDPVEVTTAWARASIGSAPNGAAYVSIHNNGADSRKLVGADTPVAHHAAIHRHDMIDGMMTMRAVDAWHIDGGATATMEPGGHHIMLMKLQTKLVEGETFPLTLKFDDGTTIETEVRIAGIGARAAPEQANGEMTGHHAHH